MKNETSILFLSMEDVLALGGSNLPLAAEEILRGFLLLQAGEIQQPHKTTLRRPMRDEQGNGLVNVLPSYINLPGQEIYGIKALGAMPSNVDRGLPRASGLILLFDPVSKTPLCVMDAQVISATRTGAVSALAAKALILRDEESVGLIGAGVNMRTQLMGLKEALPWLKSVRVFSRGNSREIFAREMGQRLELEIMPVDSVEAAAKGMRTLVTCLANLNHPVLMDIHVEKEGVTIFNIGCHECETRILRRMNRVIADVWEQGKHRGVQTHAIAVRDGVIQEDKIEDLAPILSEQKRGRIRHDENIFFCPTGLGFQDALVAWRVYQKALQSGAGVRLSLWKNPKWI
jgi:ornithine cyclodeaminase/alanine dehydrogenase-like protein (mu-crystallin family)